MAYCMDAHISIGGILSTSAARALFKLARSEGVGLDWGEYSVGDYFEDFLQVIVANCSLTFFESDRAWGKFEAIEEFCIEHELTFVAHASGNGEWDAVLRWWSPGMPSVRSAESNEDADVVLTASAVRNALGSEGPADVRLARLETLLSHAAPPRLPDLAVMDIPRL
jgi:hypothetical protein